MCPNWPTCEYSHHTQLLSLSGGLKLRNLLLATMTPTMSEMSRLNVQPHALGPQQVRYRRSLSRRVQSKVASSKVFDYVARDVPVNLLIQVAP